MILPQLSQKLISDVSCYICQGEVLSDAAYDQQSPRQSPLVYLQQPVGTDSPAIVHGEGGLDSLKLVSHRERYQAGSTGCVLPLQKRIFEGRISRSIDRRHA